MRALADGEDAPPPQEDAWDAAMKRGLRQEGRRTDTEQIAHEKEHAAEIDSERAGLRALREQVRFMVAATAGGAVLGGQSFDNRAFATAAGSELQIGGGLRKGFGLRWEVVAHGFLTVISPAKSSSFSNFSSSGCTTCLTTTSAAADTDRRTPSVVGGSVDATARLHFGGIHLPGYVGAGLRVDALRYSLETKLKTTYGSVPVATTTYDDSKLLVLASGVLEVGVVIGKTEFLDLGFRVCAGPGNTHVNLLTAAFTF